MDDEEPEMKDDPSWKPSDADAEADSDHEEPGPSRKRKRTEEPSPQPSKAGGRADWQDDQAQFLLRVRWRPCACSSLVVQVGHAWISHVPGSASTTMCRKQYASAHARAAREFAKAWRAALDKRGSGESKEDKQPLKLEGIPFPQERAQELIAGDDITIRTNTLMFWLGGGKTICLSRFSLVVEATRTSRLLPSMGGSLRCMKNVKPLLVSNFFASSIEFVCSCT